MLVNVLPDGTVECLHNEVMHEAFDCRARMRRASHVEWDNQDQAWCVKVIQTGEEWGGFKFRSEALAFEVELLEARMKHEPGSVDRLVSGRNQ